MKILMLILLIIPAIAMADLPHWKTREAIISLQAQNTGLHKMLLLGDSNTEAYWWNINSGCTTINAGFGGARIRDIANMADEIARVTQPKYVHLMIGTNNINLDHNSSEWASMQSDLQTIVNIFIAYGSKVILWPIPPFASNFSTDLTARSNINKIIQNVAYASNYQKNSFLDWWWPNQITATDGYATGTSLQTDGVHLSASSQLSRYYRFAAWTKYIVALTGVNCN